SDLGPLPGPGRAGPGGPAGPPDQLPGDSAPPDAAPAPAGCRPPGDPLGRPRDRPAGGGGGPAQCGEVNPHQRPGPPDPGQDRSARGYHPGAPVDPGERGVGDPGYPGHSGPGGDPGR